MADKRPRRRNWPPEVLDRIADLATKDPRPSGEQIRLSLERDFPAGTPIPSSRLIRDLVAQIKPLDPADVWSLTGAAPGVIPFVLPVLAIAAETASPRLTNAEADMIDRIRRGANDLDLDAVYQLARLYVARQARAAPVDDLDLFLAFAPWRDEASALRYFQLVVTGKAPPAPHFLAELIDASFDAGERAFTGAWHREGQEPYYEPVPPITPSTRAAIDRFRSDVDAAKKKSTRKRGAQKEGKP